MVSDGDLVTTVIFHSVPLIVVDAVVVGAGTGRNGRKVGSSRARPAPVGRN